MDDLVSIPDAPCTTLLDLMRDIYLRAQKNNYWLISRFCFSQFNYSLNDLTDSLTLLAARNCGFFYAKTPRTLQRTGYYERNRLQS